MKDVDDTKGRKMTYRHRDYAVTLTGEGANLAAFEAVLDRLPEAVMLGSEETNTAALVFTVTAIDPAQALAQAGVAIVSLGLTVPDGASLSVLEHAA